MYKTILTNLFQPLTFFKRFKICFYLSVIKSFLNNLELMLKLWVYYTSRSLRIRIK
jgi:hypothetical protein